MKASRRKFIRNASMLAAGAMAMGAKSYARIIGANDRVRVGVLGFSDRFRQSLWPAFSTQYKQMNFDVVAIGDIWKKRREEGQKFLADKMAHEVTAFRNSEELFAM